MSYGIVLHDSAPCPGRLSPIVLVKQQAYGLASGREPIASDGNRWIVASPSDSKQPFFVGAHIPLSGVVFFRRDVAGVEDVVLADEGSAQPLAAAQHPADVHRPYDIAAESLHVDRQSGSITLDIVGKAAIG